MKLLRCHIDNFGKISELNLDFTNGINVINEPNAWGKSTLAAFIKAMLYGLESKKESGAFAKERTLYCPWQGGAFGGTLDFEVNGRAYRIARTFGNTEKTDVFHIYDLATMLESVDFTENVGAELFDLDGASFKRSVYIAQNDCEGVTTDAINAKLGNLAANTNDMNNYETAQELLKNLMNGLSPSRATGSIKKRSAKLLEMEQELLSLDAAESALLELQSKQAENQEKKEALMAQRDAYAKELEHASEESARDEQRKNYLALCKEQEQRLSALLPYSEKFAVGIPTEEEFAAAIHDAQEMSDERSGLRHLELTEEELENYGRYQVMFAKGTPTDEAVDLQLEKLRIVDSYKEERTKIQIKLGEREREWLQIEERPDSKKPAFPVAGVVGLVLAPLGLIGEILGALSLVKLPALVETMIMIACAILFAVGIVLILVGIHGKSKNIVTIKEEQEAWNEKRAKQKQFVEELQAREGEFSQKIWNLNQEVRVFLEDYQVYCSEEEFTSRLYELKSQTREFARLQQKQENREQTDRAWMELRQSLIAFCSHYGFSIAEDPVAELTELRTEAAKYRLALGSAEEVKKRIADFEQHTDMQTLLQPSGETRSLAEINEGIHALDEELENCRAAMERYSRQAEELSAQMDLREEKQAELSDLKQVQEREQHKYEIVTMTADLLGKAKENFTSKYMAPITEAFEKYYALLTGEKREDWVIDAHIAFHKRELGQLRDTRQMSAGYQDLIGVCMRLALVDAMYEEEKPFLILDDPFVNLDEGKTKKGMELLSQVAKEYQTIYFTCHSSREPVVED